MLSKEAIQKLLAEDDRAIARALLVLNERQTSDEQAQEGTRWLNGMGFRPCHARMGTSMAKFFKRNGFLTPKQIAYWRVKDRTGNTRIEIYWKQLQEAAAMKAAKVNVVVLAPTEGMRDLGNDMERLEVLKYEYGMVLDSDDDKLIEPLKREIDEIEAYWKDQQKKG